MRPPPPQLTFRQSMEATDLLIKIINLVVQDDAVAMELALTMPKDVRLDVLQKLARKVNASVPEKKRVVP